LQQSTFSDYASNFHREAWPRQREIPVTFHNRYRRKDQSVDHYSLGDVSVTFHSVTRTRLRYALHILVNTALSSKRSGSGPKECDDKETTKGAGMTDRTKLDPGILRRITVQLKTGLARSTLYLHIANGTFPRPIKIGKRRVGWRASDVNDWLSIRGNRVTELDARESLAGRNSPSKNNLDVQAQIKSDDIGQTSAAANMSIKKLANQTGKASALRLWNSVHGRD
jgi:prophage regulatory protein